jgi:septal ring-binding cell division protein DamX
MNPKQQEKKKIVTPMNVGIFLLAVVIISTCAYLFILPKGDLKNEINESHGKIISYADSSKKDGSNSGSSTSKSSGTNEKPNGKSTPAGKGVISSNPGLIGTGGSDEPNGEDDDEGDKREKKLKKSSSTGGGSTEEDSEED